MASVLPPRCRWKLFDNLLVAKMEVLQKEADPLTRAQGITSFIQSTCDHSLRRKSESWKQLIEDHGNDDPWGLVYHVMVGKLREITPLRIVETAVGHISDITEAIRVMIEALLSGDSKGSVDIAPEMDNTLEFTAEEFDKVIKDLKLRKAPGYDNITAEIVKRTYSRIRTCLQKTYNELLRIGRFPECCQ
ncbi:hypothetical protein PR048_006651 [Dryococelus australis]|uniref:Uncharacterized protein n=1 Tax=Dryococelus australis TaxID=614101 RepID=A0ABQ9IBK5_9NEOP|nr:hypothetical protein PR048_006651 [Dryococelus australis]